MKDSRLHTWLLPTPASVQLFITWRHHWTRWVQDLAPHDHWLLLPSLPTQAPLVKDWWLVVPQAWLVELLQKIELLGSEDNRTFWLEQVFPHPQPNTLTGGRLQSFVGQWVAMGASPWVCETLRNGLKLKWTTYPPRQLTHNVEIRQDGRHQRQLQMKMAEMVALGGAQVLAHGTAPSILAALPPGAIVSPTFVVEFPKWRQIGDFRQLNRQQLLEHFKMTNMSDIVHLFGAFKLLQSLDIADAFLHIPLHRREWSRCLLYGSGTLWRVTVMMFGLHSAPRVFKKVLQEPIKILQLNGVPLVDYVDDLELMSNRPEDAIYHLLMTLRLLQLLGWRLKWKKAELIPLPRRIFVGLQWDLHLGTVHLPRKKLLALQARARLLMLRRSASLKSVASFLGQVQAALITNPALQLFVRPLQRAQLAAMRRAHHLPVRQMWQRTWVGLNQDTRTHLRRLADWLTNWNGRSFLSPSFQQVIYADACTSMGMGANALDSQTGKLLRVSVPWTPALLQQYFPFLDTHQLRHAIQSGQLGTLVPNNVLEAISQDEGLRRLIQRGLHLEAGWNVLHMSDNTTTVSYIRRAGGTVSWMTSIVAERLWNQHLSLGTIPSSQHVPGVNNVFADLDSRQTLDRYGWAFLPTLLTEIDRLWGPHTLEAFATADNSWLPRYCTRFPGDPRAAGTNGLLSPWHQENLWLNPPWILIPSVLTRLRQQSASATLVTPCWPTQHWYPVLVQLSVDLPVLLLQTSRFLREDGDHLCYPTYPLVIWRLSASSELRQEFQARLQTLWSQQTVAPLRRAISIAGVSFIAGRCHGLPVPWHPLSASF